MKLFSMGINMKFLVGIHIAQLIGAFFFGMVFVSLSMNMAELKPVATQYHIDYLMTKSLKELGELQTKSI